ncbi:binary toxin-like calcium binding domain-containing protein [Bacillus sp. 196mf]|uniref:binary toxin-like calcium binding domain-containing protein n=1 Tax=Bacillus sp. 196mf TaxID=1761754 RepID=UPI000D7C7064|nr:binary toxin-like calcium binding domain-containing protein [Bacillus sp. 196mf]PYE88561.1 putative cell wall binding repeat protein [Bacillus sp. 196mf]
MKLNKVWKCLATTALMSQLVVSTGTTTAFAATNQPTQNEAGVKQEGTKSMPGHGLVGYYYKDADCKELVMMSRVQDGNIQLKKEGISDLLPEQNQQIQSAVWKGLIEPTESGEYTFSTSDNQHVQLQVDGKDLIKQEDMKQSVKLEKGKTYVLQMKYTNPQPGQGDTLLDLQLSWSKDGGTKVVIPQENLLQSKSTEKTKQQNGPKRVKKSADADKEDLTDTGHKGIPDEWARKGYTSKGHQIVPWPTDEEQAKRWEIMGFKKYVSNPYEVSTTGDPYSDVDKVTGNIDEAVAVEAHDPLVAAVPVISVDMTDYMITPIINGHADESKSETKHTSESDSKTGTWHLDGKISATVEAKIGLFEWGKASGTFEISGGYSQASTHSTSTGKDAGDSHSSGSSWSTLDSAAVNTNIRYYNVGTAPMMQVKPTISFALGDMAIATVTAKENHIANVLAPGKQYGPIALNKMDDFGSGHFTLNKDQLNIIEKGEKPFILRTEQVDGKINRKTSAGHKESSDSSESWSNYYEGVLNKTANIILDTGDQILDRRVAARDFENPEDGAPTLTIGQAIQKAFNAKMDKDGHLYYTDKNGKKILLDENAISIMYGKGTEKTPGMDTAAEIQKQLEKQKDEKEKKVYNMKLKRGMTIVLKKPVFYDDFDQIHQEWKNTDIDQGTGVNGNAGRVTPGVRGTTTIKGLKPYTTYTMGAYVKTTGEKGQVQFIAGYDESNSLDLNNKYQYAEWSFTTGEKPQDVEIGMQAYNDKVCFDNVRLTELNTLSVGEKEKLKKQMGWGTVDGKKVYYHENGSKVKGWKEIEGKKYYFDKDGFMHQWTLHENGKQYYFNEDGTMHIGWLTWNSDQTKSYFNEDGSLITGGWKEIEGKKYYFDGDGKVKKGPFNVDGNLCYTNEDGSLNFFFQPKDNQMGPQYSPDKLEIPKVTRVTEIEEKAIKDGHQLDSWKGGGEDFRGIVFKQIPPAILQKIKKYKICVNNGPLILGYDRDTVEKNGRIEIPFDHAAPNSLIEVWAVTDGGQEIQVLKSWTKD